MLAPSMLAPQRRLARGGNLTSSLRLLWMLDTVPGLREAADKGEVMFGCVDSWLIYKLTGKHMTEGV